jgi:CubicO group peptidase (beta-lactamase class C family)
MPGRVKGRGGAAGLIDAAVAERVIPGAVLAAGVRTAEPLLLHVAGYAQDDAAGRRPMTAGTIFDLASLTKVVATTSCILRLEAGGELSLDDPVREYLPGFAGPGKDSVTVRQLLAHTSGLPDHRTYYEYLSGPESVRAAALAEPLASTPGSAFCYSDVGFMLLGELAAAVTGTRLDMLVRRLVSEPLGMTGTGFLPGTALRDRVAATEVIDGAAKVGVVHDENAEALGGVAGHAGLFGTASDLARFAAAWTGGGAELLPDPVRAEALRCQTEGLGGRRGLGWGLRGDRWDNMGDGWPASGAGHTGFTGTSLSVDAGSGLWAVLLTNAVHYGRGPGHSVVGLRKRVHAAVAAELLG